MGSARNAVVELRLVPGPEFICFMGTLKHIHELSKEVETTIALTEEPRILVGTVPKP